MKPVLHAPMRTHHGRQRLGAQGARADVIAPLEIGLLVANDPHRVDASDRDALGPVGRIDDALGRQHRSDLADGASVAALDPIAAVDRGDAVLIDEGGLDRFEQLGLVALDHQQVVALLRNDLFGNAFLAAHGVDRDQQPLDRERLQQLRNRGDLVALGGDLLLAEHQSQLGGEGADHVDRALAAAARAAHGLAVNCDRAGEARIVAERTDHAAHPAPEHVLELLRIERTQDPKEGLLGRDAVLEHEEATQPRLLGACPESDVLDRVAVREHGGDQDHQDLPEVVQGAVARLARIIDFVQTTHQGTPLRRTHALRPKDESRRDFRRVHKMNA